MRWLVSDQLGTPRMVIDQTGSLVGVRRHDYLPFGEEIQASAWRTQERGYKDDAVRQRFTGYERDAETGLDFAQARYFASAQGRFTAVDPLLASARAGAPQTWNRYAFVVNNPLRLVDPSGKDSTDQGQAQNIPPLQNPPIPIDPTLMEVTPPAIPMTPIPTASEPVVTDSGPTIQNATPEQSQALSAGAAAANQCWFCC